jgi:hypothetical protein
MTPILPLGLRPAILRQDRYGLTLVESVIYADIELGSLPCREGVSRCKPTTQSEIVQSQKEPELNGYQLATLWNFSGLFETRRRLSVRLNKLRVTT